MVSKSAGIGGAGVVARAIFFVLSFWVVSALAQQPPSEIPSARVVDDALPRKPSTGLVLGSDTVRFEQTTLSEIGGRTANVVTNHSVGDKDGRRGSTWLCYTLIKGQQRQRFWLTSDDVFGGDGLVTGVYAVVLKPSDSATQDCPDRSRYIRAVSFDNKIWLGASTRQIELSLGTAPPEADGWWGYMNVSQRIDNTRHAREFQVYSRFDVRLSKGHVVEIRASQISET